MEKIIEKFASTQNTTASKKAAVYIAIAATVAWVATHGNISLIIGG